jgi:outer membrane protein
MDVTRDQAIVRLRENNVAVLTRELKATQDRFAVGEVTRTDVAQSEARRAGAISALELARSNLKTSRAFFERVVGHAPGELAQVSGYEASLPKTHAEAVSLGTHENPAVVGALYREQAARYSVDRIRGELLPQFQLEAGYSDRFDGSRFGDESETEVATITGRLRVPLYESGEVYARVRQAKHVHVSLLQEIEQARSEAEAAVTTAWFQLAASRAQLESDRIQVDANRTALAGVRAEEQVGQRTILDVLDAELELLNAEVQLATTRRTLVVNAYTLLSTIGRLDVTNLGVTSVVYDPNVNYEETRRRWWGVSITHEDGRSEELYVERAGEAVK